MSKSDESGKGVIFLNDKPENAKAKVMSAATDSESKIAFDPDKQPGIANLLQIYGLLNGTDTEGAAKEFTGQTKYGPFKQKAADRLAEFLADFQSKYAKVDENAIKHKLEVSEEQMNKIAGAKLTNVQKAVGLR
jgi:tryptophanyl-tRNA synthetase